MPDYPEEGRVWPRRSHPHRAKFRSRGASGRRQADGSAGPPRRTSTICTGSPHLGHPYGFRVLPASRAWSSHNPGFVLTQQNASGCPGVPQLRPALVDRVGTRWRVPVAVPGRAGWGGPGANHSTVVRLPCPPARLMPSGVRLRRRAGAGTSCGCYWNVSRTNCRRPCPEDFSKSAATGAVPRSVKSPWVPARGLLRTVAHVRFVLQRPARGNRRRVGSLRSTAAGLRPIHTADESLAYAPDDFLISSWVSPTLISPTAACADVGPCWPRIKRRLRGQPDQSEINLPTGNPHRPSPGWCPGPLKKTMRRDTFLKEETFS